MTIKIKSRFIAFNDGLADSYAVADRRITKIRQERIHFNQASVGERRYWDAYVSGVQITMAVKVPLGTKVDQGDLLVIDEKQYIVVQKDYKDDKMPACWLLSLSASPIAYKVREDGGDN
ncbi:MAG: hypothetical protein IJ225_10485 [Solobacterium sp.]|nr:hypothetical protein [Solobacterium sp.]